MPQPNFVPVMRSESRSTHKRGVPGAALTSRVLPLITRGTMETPSGYTVRFAGESYSGGPWKSIVAKRRKSGGECAAGVRGRGCAALGKEAASTITRASRPRRRQPSESGGIPSEIPALRFAPHRRAERAHRTARVLAGSRHGVGERRQRHVPLRFLDRFQRLARAAVVSVRRGLSALLRIHAAAQRAYPDRRGRRQPVAPRADVDRHLRHALLSAADGSLYHVALLADSHYR